MNNNLSQLSDNISTSKRQSNFELLRIILTLFVIGHHYVVNSGLMECFDYSHITGNMIFLKCYSIFGKISVNAFGLITGYFMVNSSWRWKKWLKLYVEVKFYQLFFYIIFTVTGYAPFDYHDLLVTLFNTVFTFGTSYTSTFIVFYLFIPFLNIIVQNTTRRQHFVLLGLLVFVFTGISTFSYFLSVRAVNNDTWNYLGWMMCLYLIGSYLAKYPSEILENKQYMMTCFFVNTFVAWASILVIDFIGRRFDFGYWFWLFNDSHKLLAITGAVFLFCWFKQLSIHNSIIINKLASTTFGVFLIHSISPEMRSLLWNDILKCVSFYDSKFLFIHALLSTFGIFIVCALIDFIRKSLIEKPLFSWIAMA